MESYQMENGIIYSQNGLPYAPRWFADTRISFQMENSGMSGLLFYSKWGKGHEQILNKQFWGNMKFYLFNDKVRYIITPGECEITPYGFLSRNKICGLSLEFSIYTVDNKVLFRIQPGADFPSAYSFGIEFCDDLRFIPVPEGGDIRQGTDRRRVWKDSAIVNNEIIYSFSDEDTETYLAFGAEQNLQYSKSYHNHKNRMVLPELEPEKVHTVCLGFGPDEKTAVAESRLGVREQVQLLEKIAERYARVLEKAPILYSGNESLDRIFRLIPIYHESLKIMDMPGALRAKTTKYWMWGWDTMTSGAAISLWGDRDFLKDITEFMIKHSSNNKVPMAFDRDMSGRNSSTPLAVQGIFVNLLQLLSTHDINVDSYYSFAKNSVEDMMQKEKDNMGLYHDYSLVPDYRNLIRETDENGISTFNNCIAYCAIRVMEYFSHKHGDHKLAEKLRAFAERTEKNFDRLFNEKFGYYDSSIDGKTLKQRDVISNNNVKLENDYLLDITEKRIPECMKYYKEKVMCESGLRGYTADYEFYDADANQLSAWWPNVTEFFAKTANLADAPEALEKWIGYITRWTDMLIFPEGISCYVDNPLYEPDNWNSESGTWQAFGMRAFYASLVENYVGVSLDCGGVTLNPYSGKELSLNGLHFGEKILNVNMKGSGKYIEKLIVNGETLTGTNKIPSDMLEQENNIVVYRTSVKPQAFIRTAMNVDISNYAFDGSKYRFSAKTFGRGKIKMQASQTVSVQINGEDRKLEPDAQGNIIVSL